MKSLDTILNTTMQGLIFELVPVVVINAPLHEKNKTKKQQFGFPTRSDTNRPIQSQKQAWILIFWF